MANITDVRIYQRGASGSLRAYASVTLDNAYAVHGLKVMEGETGLWVRMPASKNKKGEFKDVFHPISKEAREALVSAVLAAYEKSAASAPAPEQGGEMP